MHAPKLKLSMQLGALYDVLLGLAIVLALAQLARILPIAMPAQPFYARMAGVLLIGLGGIYALAGHDLERHLRVVAAAIAVRTLGGLYIGLAPLLDSSLSWFFLVFGAADLAWAGIHLILLRHERHLAFWPLLLRGEQPA